MSTQTHAGWAELRDALGEEPGELAFRAVASILDTWPGDDISEALSFADERLSSWPDETRGLRPGPGAAPRRGASPHRAWLWLARCEPGATTLAARRSPCGTSATDRSCVRSRGWRLVCVTKCRASGPCTKIRAGGRRCGTWTARATTWTDDDASFLALGQSPLIRQLEFLRVDLEGRRADVRKRLVLHAERLVRLILSTGINDNLVRLFETSHLPCLRELALTHGGCDPSSAEAARRLAQLPALARLTRLESWVCFPEEVLVPLFETLPSRLEALVIMGNPYIDYAPELISSDVWLSPSAMRVVAESASLKSVARAPHRERASGGCSRRGRRGMHAGTAGAAGTGRCRPDRRRRRGPGPAPSARGSDPPRPACQPARTEGGRGDLPLALPGRGDDTGDRRPIL